MKSLRFQFLSAWLMVSLAIPLILIKCLEALEEYEKKNSRLSDK